MRVITSFRPGTGLFLRASRIKSWVWVVWRRSHHATGLLGVDLVRNAVPDTDRVVRFGRVGVEHAVLKQQIGLRSWVQAFRLQTLRRERGLDPSAGRCTVR